METSTFTPETSTPLSDMSLSSSSSLYSPRTVSPTPISPSSLSPRSVVHILSDRLADSTSPSISASTQQPETTPQHQTPTTSSSDSHVSGDHAHIKNIRIDKPEEDSVSAPAAPLSPLMKLFHPRPVTMTPETTRGSASTTDSGSDFFHHPDHKPSTSSNTGSRDSVDNGQQRTPSPSVGGSRDNHSELKKPSGPHHARAHGSNVRLPLLQSRMKVQHDQVRVTDGDALHTLQLSVEKKVLHLNEKRVAEDREHYENKLIMWSQFKGPASFEIYTGKNAVERFEQSYEFMTKLGKGSFANVVRVRRRDAPLQQYALKIVDKAKLNVGNNVRDEVEILRTIRHPFIIRLEDAFETKDHLCCLLELMVGGTGHDILTQRNLNSMIAARRRPISERCAQFYAAELILALECLHSRNIVHRDLKPDNCFLDHEGHMRVADLGIARQLRADSPVSLKETIGQEGFKAPEMLTGEGYGLCVDYWNLGVLLYTFLAMRHPFHSILGNSDKTALTQEYERLKDNSDEVNDLIERLLVKDYRRRLGYGGIHEIKEHLFFRSIDWKKLLNKEVKPPPFRVATRNRHSSGATQSGSGDHSGMTLIDGSTPSSVASSPSHASIIGSVSSPTSTSFVGPPLPRATTTIVNGTIVETTTRPTSASTSSTASSIRSQTPPMRAKTTTVFGSGATMIDHEAPPVARSKTTFVSSSTLTPPGSGPASRSSSPPPVQPSGYGYGYGNTVLRDDKVPPTLKMLALDESEKPTFPDFAAVLQYFHDTDPATVTL